MQSIGMKEDHYDYTGRIRRLLPFSRCVAGTCARVSAKAHHHRRPVRRGRADRHGGAAPRRADGQVPQDADHRGERGRRRRHHRRGPGGQGAHPTATRSCSTTSAMSTAPALYRKLPYDPVDDFEPIGLVNDVPMTLVAQEGLSAEGPQGAHRLRQGEQGQGHLRQRRPRRRLAPVRHAVHERDRHRPHDGAVQGHGPGHERSARRPGRLHVRPDHQHDQPDQGRQDQGLRRHDQEPRAFAAGVPTMDEAGLPKASRSRSGTPFTRRRARRSR